MRRPKAGATLALLALAPLGVAYATEDEKPADSGLTETVEVDAPLPDGEDIAAFSTTLDADEVAQRAQDLADLMRRVPGARVRDYGGMGSYATLSLRASTAEQVTVMIDGVPQNRALGGPMNLGSIPATQVEEVTVFRGFAPASYGLGGIGGLVDVRTRAPGPEPTARVDLLAGQLQTGRLSSGVSFEAGGGMLRLGAEALRSEGDFLYFDGAATPFNTEDDGERRRVNNDVEQDAVFAQQAWENLGNSEVRVGLRFQRREQGVPGLGNAQSETARLDESLDDLTASWRWRGSSTLEGFDLLLDGFREGIRLFDPLDDIGTGAADRTTRMGGAGIVGLFRLKAGRHAVLVRNEARYERADVRDRLLGIELGGAERVLLGMTAEDVVNFGRLTLAPSLRWQSLRNEFKQGDVGGSPDDIDTDALTGRLGVAYRISEGLALRGSAGTFQRNPSLRELFGETGTVIGNPDLGPEQGETVELGLDWSGGGRLGWQLEVVGFARHVEDLIWLKQNSQATTVPVNLAAADVRGLETWLSLRDVIGVSVEVSATLQRCVDSSGGFTDGQPLPYQPNLLGFVGVAYQRAGWLVRGEANYVGENSTTQIDLPAFRIPERILYDAAAAYRFRNGLGLGLDVRNVFDRRTLDLMRYPLPGRVVSLNLGWRSDGRRP